MECVVSRAARRCGGWTQDVGAAFVGRNLQPGGCAARWRVAEHADSEFESGEDRMPGATGECDRADHDECGWGFLAHDFLFVQWGAAVCAWRGVGCAGGIVNV